MREQLKREANEKILAAKNGGWHIESDVDLIARQDEYIDQLVVVKDTAYSERNKLVAALSKLFPASLERHPKDDRSWEDDWRWIVMMDLPSGQVSWHVHDSELPNFNHLHREAENYHSWDGHTTEEKYRRLAAIQPKRQ